MGWPAAVISLKGLEQGSFSATATVLETRLRKLLARQIGLLALGMAPSDVPASLLHLWIQTPEQLDALPERLPGY